MPVPFNNIGATITDIVELCEVISQRNLRISDNNKQGLYKNSTGITRQGRQRTKFIGQELKIGNKKLLSTGKPFSDLDMRDIYVIAGLNSIYASEVVKAAYTLMETHDAHSLGAFVLVTSNKMYRPAGLTSNDMYTSLLTVPFFISPAVYHFSLGWMPDQYTMRWCTRLFDDFYVISGFGGDSNMDNLLFHHDGVMFRDVTEDMPTLHLYADKIKEQKAGYFLHRAGIK